MSSPDLSQSSPSDESEPRHDPYAAMRIRDYRWFLSGNLPYLVGLNMQTTAVSWEIYDRTKSKFALAMVGLVQIVPVVGLFMPAGHLIDRVDRRKILMAALLTAMICSTGLAYCSWTAAPVMWMYVFLLFIGVARTFMQPARAAFLPQIVPREMFSNAVTWSSTGFQLSSVLGPAAAGPLIAWQLNGTLVYSLAAAMALYNGACLAMIRSRPFVPSREPPTLAALAAGLSFVWRTKVMLGAITLDMFAVLLGGVTALLPVYQEDILKVDPNGFGWMRAAPGIGAVCMSFLLAHRPPLERAGRALLLAVAGFGVVTIVFGFSRVFALSLAMLLLLGALDMISVVVRHTLVQLLTPDDMRGRVSAVNGMFIGISNELGEFESGMVAHAFDRDDNPAFGPTVSAVSGGVGTLLVVAAVGLIWPQLRNYGRLNDTRPAGEKPREEGRH
jgi:MFS family permease